MWNNFSPRLQAIIQAVFVTFLWATSWVLIRIGLHDIPALTFAGLRYTLAFLCLLPLIFRGGRLTEIRQLTRREWANLMILGLLFYTVTQGTQFLALSYLTETITLSLLLNFTSLITAFMGILFLNERLTNWQWGGIVLFLFGVLVYFYPVSFPVQDAIGITIGAISVIANSAAAVLGRQVNRSGKLSPIVITTISMGVGALILLIAGLATQGLPQLTATNWLFILWLAIVNTALAFTLWNHTLRVLSAIESSVINNTILPQIAILAWIFLGETISPQEIVGLLLAIVGILIVQIWRRA